MHDLIVVGAGPAGTMCAREAALRGLDVLLLDKFELPREKLCGGALSPRVKTLVDFDISPVVERDVHCAVIHTPSGRRIDIIREDARGYLVKRRNFDYYMTEKAREAGVDVIDGTKVLSVEQLKTGIRVLSAGDSYKAQLLVGADGVNSIVARQVNLRKGWPADRVALCIAANVPISPSEIDRILTIDEQPGRVSIESYPWAIDYGYAWCFPKSDEISIGIGYKMGKKVLDLRSAWTKFVERFEKEKNIKLEIANRSAQRVPLGKLNQRITARRTMLVGDAAGLVSPITGEGLYYAMRSGQLAGQVAYETVKTKSPLHVRVYEHRLKQEMNTEFSAANFVSSIAYKSKKKIELVCDLAQNDPIMQDFMIDLALGTRSISDIRKDITKRMLRHYPLKALRLLR
ncbi:MAG: geranylgeranyl reductase family protein [Candidatus Thorarchaeota archaeon]